MSFRALLPLALLAPSMAWAVPSKKVVNDVSAADVVSLLEGHATVHDESTDKVGDPLLVMDADGTKFVVLFYDCAEVRKERRCGEFQFHVAWAAGGSIPVDAMNAWTSKVRAGRAYLDSEGDPTLELAVPVAPGVRWGLLEARRDAFFQNLDLFTKFLETL